MKEKNNLDQICPCDLGEFCSTRSDQELVEYVKENKECFRMLIGRYEEKLKRYVRRISGLAAESVEDIVQDVFLKVYTNLNSYDPKRSFSSWIYRIAHNETINLWRRNKRKNEMMISLDTESALDNLRDEKNLEAEVFGKLDGRIVLRALENINEQYRDAIVLNNFQEASYREISDKLEVPIGTVGTLINRGKKMLREHMERNGYSSEALAG